jgi:hypothetical protein
MPWRAVSFLAVERVRMGRARTTFTALPEIQADDDARNTAYLELPRGYGVSEPVSRDRRTCSSRRRFETDLSNCSALLQLINQFLPNPDRFGRERLDALGKVQAANKGV